MGETSLKIKKLGHMEGVSSFADGDVVYGVKENRTVQVPKSVFLADDRHKFNQLKDYVDNLSGDNTEFLKAYEQHKRGTDHEIGYACIRKAFNSYMYVGTITEFLERGVEGASDKKYKCAWLHYEYPWYTYTVIPTGGSRKGERIKVKGYFFKGGNDLSVMNPGAEYNIGIVVGTAFCENNTIWHGTNVVLGGPEYYDNQIRDSIIARFDVLLGNHPVSPDQGAALYDGVHIKYYNYRPNDRNITSVKFIVNVNRTGGMTQQSFSDWAYPPTVKDWYHYDAANKAYPDTDYKITESQYNDLVAKGLILS